MKITKHPTYSAMLPSWQKWRLTYKGGTSFIEEYLEKFSDIESETEFTSRKNVSYCPAFAKAAINDIKNAIFQRTADITRSEISPSYKAATLGSLGGVDNFGSTINAFIGRRVLPELLSISKVGVYVDMPVLDAPLLIQDAHPYLYTYKAEDIFNWTYDGQVLINLILRDTIDVVEDGFVKDTAIQYRVFYKEENSVKVEIYDKDEVLVSTTVLEIPYIPFITFEITDSLLADIADYQIALVNLASSDMNYSLRCNFPFYTEQYDPRLSSMHLETETETQKTEIEVGSTTGRRYPKGVERPGFINPSSEPLKASMEKQAQLKSEIKQIVALSLSNIEPKMASAESKSLDQQGLEAGLSYIGLELETGERNIAIIWAKYEGLDVDPTIKYPTKYSLESDSEKRKQAADLGELTNSVPSNTYKKAIAREIAGITIGAKVSIEELETIYSEINSSNVMNITPDVIAKDVEIGLVDIETASVARGYPVGSAEKAKQDHAERLARISLAQTKAARGLKDQAAFEDGRTEKDAAENNDNKDVVKERVRGEGK